MTPFGNVAGLTVIVGHTGATVKLRVPSQPLSSVTVMVNVALVAEVGVPLIVSPVRVRPAGRMPLETAKL